MRGFGVCGALTFSKEYKEYSNKISLKSAQAPFFGCATVNTFDKPAPDPILATSTYTQVVENTEIIELVRLLAEENPHMINWVLLFAIASVAAKQLLTFLGGVISESASIWADKNTKNWEQYQTFNDLIEEAMTETGACNAYVIKCHNGGGIPRPGVPTFSTITNRFGPGSSKNIWDSFPHDGELSRIVTEILRNQSLVIETSDLTDCDLKTALEEAKVSYQVSVLLDSSRKRIVYCTFHFKEMFLEAKAAERLKKLRLRSHAIAEMVGDRGLIALWPSKG